MDDKTQLNRDPGITHEHKENMPQESLLHVILWHRWTIFHYSYNIPCDGSYLSYKKQFRYYTSDSRLYVEQKRPKNY